MLLAMGMSLRTYVVKKDFDNTAREAFRRSAGYDKQFVSMVNRLEYVLTTRARFGYMGGKDPMTGQERTVVKAPVVRKQRKRGAKKEKKNGGSFRLAAVIYDPAGKQFEALVMDGERSHSVNKGDVIRGRRVTQITKNSLLMESKTHQYYYDIEGNYKTRKK